MANYYIDITKNSKDISGIKIQKAVVGKFIRIIRGNGKEVVPCNTIKINEHAVYNIIDGGSKITISAGNGWTCSRDEYDTLISDGNKIIHDIFGDIMEKTKDIK